MPYDYDPYRRNYRQGESSRSGGSSRYGNDARRTSRNQGGQRNRSGSSSYGRNSSYQNRSRYGSSSRSQDHNRRNRNGQQPDRLDSNTRRRSRNLTMPDTGYSLHSRRVRGSNGSLSHRLGMFDGRVIVLVAILVLVVVVLFTGISSCVRGANSSSTENTKQMSAADSRVAAGVSDSMVSEFSTQLDRNEKLAQIAANADQYDDDRLLQLALDEPAAISFVAGYPTAEKTTSGYNQSVSIGNPPLLYDWNTAWGYATYGDGCIAVTGSEPTTLSMAYMGLTGNTDQTPVGTAKALNSAASTSTNSNGNSSDSADASSTDTNNSNSDNSNNTDSTSSTSTTSTGSTDADTFCAAAKNLGLTPTVLNVASSTQSTSTSSSSDASTSSSASSTGAETLVASLKKGALVAVKLKSQTLTNDEHWALVVNVNADGSVSVYDPTSSSVSSHTWGAGTVASSTSEMISLVAAKTDQATSTDGANATTSSNGSTNSSSSNANSATVQGQNQSGNASSTTNGAGSSTGNGTGTTGSGSTSTGSGSSSSNTGAKSSAGSTNGSGTPSSSSRASSNG